MSTKVQVSRPPRFPDRESLSEEDRAEYDYVYQRVLKLSGGIMPPEENDYVGACLYSPPFAASLWRFSGRMLAAFSTRDSFSHKERDYINVVLAFDYGCYPMASGGHLAHAVEHLGLRPEMPKAVWEGRDEDLTDDERQLVDYIRAYVDGTVTDEMWAGIVERFGGVRGAVEYTLSIGYNLLCARSMQAMGAFAGQPVSREEMQKIVQNLGAGDEEMRRRTAGFDRKMRDPEFLDELSAG